MCWPAKPRTFVRMYVLHVGEISSLHLRAVRVPFTTTIICHCFPHKFLKNHNTATRICLLPSHNYQQNAFHISSRQWFFRQPILTQKKTYHQRIIWTSLSCIIKSGSHRAQFHREVLCPFVRSTGFQIAMLQSIMH